MRRTHDRPDRTPSSRPAPPGHRTSWAGTTVMVTGAAGFLGRHVTDRLLADGARVVGTGRGPRAGTDGIEWLVVDLADPLELAAAVGSVSPDVVVHLGGRVSGAVDPRLVPATFSTHLVSSIALLDAAREGRTGRVVLVGSTDEPRRGETPSSPYAAAKSAMTGYAQLYAGAFDAPVVQVRPSDTFGPGQAPTKLLPYVAASVLRGRRPQLSHCRRRSDWVYVDDVVDGLLVAARAAPDGAELDLGTGTLRTGREMVQALLAELGTGVEPDWGAQPDRADEPERAADVEHTAQVLGWRARTPVAEGVRRTAAAARAGAPPVS